MWGTIFKKLGLPEQQPATRRTTTSTTTNPSTPLGSSTRTTICNPVDSPFGTVNRAAATLVCRQCRGVRQHARWICRWAPGEWNSTPLVGEEESLWKPMPSTRWVPGSTLATPHSPRSIAWSDRKHCTRNFRLPNWREMTSELPPPLYYCTVRLCRAMRGRTLLRCSPPAHDVYTPSALGHRGGPAVQRRSPTIWDVVDGVRTLSR